MKTLTIVVLFIIVLSIEFSLQAHAELSGNMTQQQREQIFDKLQVSPNQQTTSNFFFNLIITPTGVQMQNIILSPDNYTALKNNVGFFTACGTVNNGLCQPPQLTNSKPNINYCPVALSILLNQGVPEYLNHIYNTTKHLDLTGLVYPVYCHIETGKNPVNNDNTIVSVPEFPNVLLLSAICFVCMIIGVTSIQRLK